MAKSGGSHDYRPLRFEGGYLPVAEVASIVLKTGVRSWWSVEVFDGEPEGRRIWRPLRRGQ